MRRLRQRLPCRLVSEDVLIDRKRSCLIIVAPPRILIVSVLPSTRESTMNTHAHIRFLLFPQRAVRLRFQTFEDKTLSHQRRQASRTCNRSLRQAVLSHTHTHTSVNRAYYLSAMRLVMVMMWMTMKRTKWTNIDPCRCVHLTKKNSRCAHSKTYLFLSLYLAFVV